MSIKQCCRLCCTACSEFKLLQNEIGGSNEIYEITVKFFDPMLLTEGAYSNNPQEIKVLCEDCWFHIRDFHEFQQTIIKTRNLLEESKELNQLQVEVKQENDRDNNHFCDSRSCSDEDNHIENVYQKNHDIYDNIGTNIIHINCDDDSDEKPLITLTKINKLQIISNDYCDKNKQRELDEKLKSCRRRKSKNCIKGNSKTENYDESHLNQTTDKRKRRKLIDDAETSKLPGKLEKGIESDAFIAEWKPELECDLCGETGPNFQNLRHHFKDKHKSRAYIKCCERKFYRRYVLVEHLRMHLNPEMHKCDICGKPSSSQYNLKLHKKIMHENTEQFECEICHKMFNQKPTLERHMLTHVTGSKDYVCQECGKAYVLEVQLKSHIKTVHNVDRVCDQCGKIIHGKAALKKHLMEHAGIEKPKFPCDKCDAELNSRNSLRRHVAAFHHDGSTIYVCGICGKVASSENALLTHKKHVHEEERKHKCTYCDKAFKRPKVLREHIATHTGQDLYQCPHCPQTFKVDANMHHHRKKVHPKEWEEGRKNRLQLPKVNINQVKNQVVL